MHSHLYRSRELYAVHYILFYIPRIHMLYLAHMVEPTFPIDVDNSHAPSLKHPPSHLQELDSVELSLHLRI